MNKLEKIEKEYVKAIKSNPTNSILYNDYAVFLDKYRNDYEGAFKYLNKALKFEPQNSFYQTNLNRIIKKYEAKSNRRNGIFLIFLIGVMTWIGYNGYTNFMNLLTLFVLAQTVLNYKNPLYIHHN